MPIKRSIMMVFSRYDQRFIAGAVRCARQQGFSTIMDPAQPGNIPAGWQGDGVLVFSERMDTLVNRAAELGLPAVCAGPRPAPALPSMIFDAGSAGEAAAEHFLERKFEHFAWLGPDPVGGGTGKAFRDAVEQAGRAVNFLPPFRQESSWSEETRRLASSLEQLPHPLGLLCASDLLAAFAAETCLKAGLSIPAQVAVLGLGNDPLVCMTAPAALSSIDSNLELLGYKAMDMLARLVSGNPVERQAMLPARRVVTRESTDTLVTRHPKVSAALDFCWGHYHESIGVPDLARAAGLSTRGLHKAFTGELDRSPLQELQRVRLIRSQDLLQHTDLKIHEISRLTGHEEAKNLYRAFTQSCDLTPRAYRQASRQDTEPSPGLRPEQVASCFSRNLREHL